MWQNRMAGLNTSMMYVGTLFLSALSFCTTFYGMTILLDFWLALIGALGIQIAMLGVAWNLMKAKENRGFYTWAFIAAAAFSIFFSFAAFHSQLKADIRAVDARSRYLSSVQPVLGEYARSAKEAISRGHYQVDRLDKLIEMEMKNGWATMIDEGSNDPYIQSVLDGARSTVHSWERTAGGNYRQGSGEGIIVNYLQAKQEQARENLFAVTKFESTIDSLMLALNSGQTIESQYQSANLAWTRFPSGEAAMLLSREVTLPAPPATAGFVDKSVSSQYDFSLVIADLANFDGVTVFSLLLAIAVDLIVILMAFAGSYSLQSEDFVLERVKQDAARRIRDMSLDDARNFTKTLNENISRLRAAGNYGLSMSRVTGEYKNARRRFRVVLSRDAESATTETLTSLEQIQNRFSPEPDNQTETRPTETAPGHFTI